jgi:hypothetical protein
MAHYLNSDVLSPKRMDVLKLLYYVRGATAKQLLCMLYPDKFPIDLVYDRESKISNNSTMKNVRQYLSDLKRQGLIEVEPFMMNNRANMLYFLSKEGLDYIMGHLDIEYRYIGSGFGDDLGYFTYDNYKPPLKRNIFHHLLLVDFFIIVREYMNNTVPGTIQYRDNRYSSVDYKVKSKSYKHRPDAELLIEDKLYWIELDRSTESGSSIENKFENFSRYLTHLEEIGHSLPEGIIFITDKKKDLSGKRKRWKTLSTAFYDSMSSFDHRINTIYCDLSELNKIIFQELASEAIVEKRVKEYVKYYLSDQGFIELNHADGLKWDNCLCTVTRLESHDQLFLYERTNCYETRGVARVAAILEYLQNGKNVPQSLKRVREVIPIFFQHEEKAHPIAIGLDSIKLPKKNMIHLQDPLWLNVYGDEPIWLYDNGEQMKVSNPLRSRKPEISFSKSIL